MADLLPVHYHQLPIITGVGTVYPEGLLLWHPSDKVIVAGDGVTPGGKRLSYPGPKGDAGQDLHIDAAGTLEDRDQYDSEESGFVFATTHIDPVTNYTTITLYVKQGSAIGAWCEPLPIVFRNGKDGLNAALIPPAEFTDNAAVTPHLMVAQTRYPGAWISAVVIDTFDGYEKQLPYGVSQGVTRITKKEGKFYVYFGALCPAFASGRVYFAQGLTSTELTPEEPEEATAYYGYIPYQKAESITKITDITEAMLLAAADTVTSVEPPAVLPKTVLGELPAYAWLFVAIPSTSSFVGTKDNGFGERMAFSLDNGQSGTGANGALVSLNGIEYKVYGEFNMVDAVYSIYID